MTFQTLSKQFLFISVDILDECTDTCACIMLEWMAHAFRYENNTLFLNPYFISNDQLKWPEIGISNLAVGLYSSWTPNGGSLSLFDSLPYSTEDHAFIVNGVNEKGEISVGLSYGNVLVPPGKNVTYEWVEEKENRCQILHTYTLTNYGFINDNQVVLEEFPQIP